MIDSQNMFEVTAALPEQVEQAVLAAQGLEGLPEAEEIQHVVVLGMGGSGICGDVLLAAAAPFMPVPVVVVKSYECPAFVGDGSLVFAISCSGNTEETVQAATDAAMQGARIVAVTGGGELAKLASGWGAPVIPVPGDIPQPRAALGAMAIPPMVVLEEVGLFLGAGHWMTQAIDQLRRRRDELMDLGAGSSAAQIAERIGDTIPLIHGGGALGAAAAQRWKAQINENAKTPAFWSVQPELCHNEVCGWDQRRDLTRNLLTLVALRHDAEHPQVSRRFDLVRRLVAGSVADQVEVRAEGEGDLAQLLDLILFGDFVSLWLAANHGVDPGPVEVLSRLKQELAGG